MRLVEDKLHVVALRSEELGNHGLLDYYTLLNKVRSLDPTLQGMRVFTNQLATTFKQYLCSGLNMKQALAKIKASKSQAHINSLLYCESYAVQLNTPQYKGYITIYTNPAIPYIPSVRIILRYPTKKCLRIFEKLFPGYLISKAEFTLDIMCESSSDTRSLFEYIMRHLFMPHRRKSSLKIIGDHGNRVDQSLKTNHAFRISHLKIYERGPDSKRKKLDSGSYGWYANDIDRIRIEYDITNSVMREWGVEVHLVERGKRKLRLILLSDFLNTGELNPLQYLNISFKTMKNLWKGTLFLSAYFKSKALERRHMKDHVRLNTLSTAIVNAVNNFMQTWTQDICKIVEEEPLDIENDYSIFDEVYNVNNHNVEQQQWLFDEGRECVETKPHKALKLLTEAVDAGLKTDEIFFCRSQAHFNLQHYGQALADLNHISIQSTHYFYRKAVIQAKLGNDQIALQLFNKALELDPENVIACLNRGELCWYEMWDSETALKDLQRVLASGGATGEDRKRAETAIFAIKFCGELDDKLVEELHD